MITILKLQKFELKCFNVYVNVNGVDVHKHTKGIRTYATTAEALKGDGVTERNGLFGNDLNIDKKLVNIYINFNHN